MRRKWISLSMMALLAIGMSMFLGCPELELQTGTLKIQFNNQIPRSTLVPDIVMETATYEVTGIGPNDKTFDETSSGEPLTITSLLKGDWGITVTAKNINDQVIGEGSAFVTIEANTTKNTNIVVVPIVGDGTLTINGSWEPGFLTDPHIVAILTPVAGGDPEDMVFNIDGTEATLAYTGDFPAGYYSMVFEFYDGDPLVAANKLIGMSLAVRIIAGQTTFGEIALSSEDLNLAGRLVLSIQEDLQNPFDVTIAEQDYRTVQGGDVTFTADVSPEDTYTYRWYIDGILTEDAESGPDFHFTADQAYGRHQIDVIVAKGNVLSSASAFLWVYEADLGYFDDEMLQAAVRTALGKPEGMITIEELESITMLEAKGYGIHSLGGLERLINLEYLDIGPDDHGAPDSEDLAEWTFNYVTDLSPLAPLVKINTLYLDCNGFSDISALANLPELVTLSMNANQVVDLTALSSCPKIDTLEMAKNQIENLDPIAGLTNLMGLNFDKNEVSDISALAGLTNLVWLNFNYNDVTDISALANLVAMQSLWFGENLVVDISPLVNLANLQKLGFNNNLIADISILSNLTNLNRLVMDMNGIQDISALTNLTLLTRLSFTKNKVVDVSPLENLINLTELRANTNYITDLEPLDALLNLVALSLAQNQITDISPLQDLVMLKILELQKNTVSDITALESLTNLEKLYLYNNIIADIGPLSDMVKLVDLGLGSNRIEESGPLATLVKLKYLELYQNRLSDISAMQTLVNLSYVSLDDNRFSDLSPLVDNAGIGSGDEVSIQYNPRLDLTADSENMLDIKALKTRGVKVYYGN
ncbi:MAG: hypothetical protein CVV52_03175 [Spirochaetae bacterium HGW-Spirochaetae-8]|nr:MAG: hypothetical protein CVV52_03175 [Spirochaetae bacterium HGW-Spirochaetae-8]